MPFMISWAMAAAVVAAAIATVATVSGSWRRAREGREISAFAASLTEADRKRWAGKRILAIANPVGGSRVAVGVYRRVLKPMCDAVGVFVELVTTKAAGQAESIAADLGKSYDLVISLSGDGMLHEVVAGLVRGGSAMSVPLAVLPCGSSNGLSKSLYGDVEPIAVARQILRGRGVSAKRANLVSATVVDSAGAAVVSWDLMGLSQAVTADVNHISEVQLRWMNRLPGGGLLKDLVAAILVIGRMRKHRVDIAFRAAPLSPSDRKAGCYRTPEELEVATAATAAAAAAAAAAVGTGADLGEAPWRATSGAWTWCETANISHLSHDCQIAPGVTPTAGAMDLVLSTGHSRSQLLSSFLKAETGGHITDPWFARYRITEVVFTPADPGHAFYMSGELIARLDAGASVLCRCHEGKALLWY